MIWLLDLCANSWWDLCLKCKFKWMKKDRDNVWEIYTDLDSIVYVGIKLVHNEWYTWLDYLNKLYKLTCIPDWV